MNVEELAKSMNQRIKKACQEYPNDIAKIYTSGGCAYIVNDSMLFDLMQNTIPLEDVMPCPPHKGVVELLQEIEAWLCFNKQPTKNQLIDLHNDVKKVLQEYANQCPVWKGCDSCEYFATPINTHPICISMKSALNNGKEVGRTTSCIHHSEKGETK